MEENTRKLAEIAMGIALSLVLNFLVLFRMPQGGSVTIAMLPIFIIAFRWGFSAGVLTGVGSGLLQLAFGAYIVHPVQLILDYPLAYGLVGVAGIFRSQIHRIDHKSQYLWIFLAMVSGALVRFLSHILSGVIFFSDLAPEGQNVWLYSIIYNGSFLLPALLLCLVLIAPLKSLIIERN